MHAVVTRVTIRDREAAESAVFESEQAAREAAEGVPPGEFVNFDSIEVGEVVASA